MRFLYKKLNKGNPQHFTDQIHNILYAKYCVKRRKKKKKQWEFLVSQRSLSGTGSFLFFVPTTLIKENPSTSPALFMARVQERALTVCLDRWHNCQRETYAFQESSLANSIVPS